MKNTIKPSQDKTVEKKKEIKLKINGFDDRRELVAILADNGYKVRITQKEDDIYYTSDYFVMITPK